MTGDVQPVAPAAAEQRSKPGRRKVTFAVGIGNTLEWYDWTVYAVMVPFFSTQFFTGATQTEQILSALAVFAVGFFMRPLGGIVFGRVADRFGRKLSLTVSMMLMALGSLLIGLIPTAATIGILAPTLLVIARLAQGIAHGAEPIAAYTYIAEEAPEAKRGLWSSVLYVFIMVGVTVGTISGAVLSGLLTTGQMESWGWRIPFIVGGLLGFYALWMRRALQETEAFKEEEAVGTTEALPSIFTVLKTHRADVFRVAGLMACNTVVFWSWAVNGPAYAATVSDVGSDVALWVGVAALCVFIVALPVWGALSDRYGRRIVGILFFICAGVLNYPLTLLSGNGAWGLFVGMSLAMIYIASLTAIIPVLFAEFFPTAVRATAMGVPYGIATAIFGGTAPYLRTWLNEKDLDWVFSVYVGVLAIFGLIAIVTARETRAVDLRK